MLVTEKDVKFKAVRSSGPGGQRANRRSTKVQIWVKIGNLPLSDIQKKRLRRKLAKHINHLDELWAENEEERTQKLNRDKALWHINKMIRDALKVPKPRIPTEPPRSAEDVRIRAKKIRSDKKRGRRISSQ
ncbi:MAG: aminoacyl-tRNA hydrolase [Patescibacteria group bacterium]|nr:aminoacyl-tRNA hydrolase [Patescibacteria group bacterium]